MEEPIEIFDEDLNTLTDYNKRYWASGNNTVANKPTGVDAFGMEVFRTATGWRIQILYSSNKNQGMFIRFIYIPTNVYNPWQKILTDARTIDTSKYMPRAVEHDNELNFGSYKSTAGTLWFNYRDGITDAASTAVINTYLFGKGLATSVVENGLNTNLSNIRAANIQADRRIIPLQGTLIADMMATSGTAGYIKFATIKINGTYANHPCSFIVGRRGSGLPWLVCVQYESVNHHAPSLQGLYQIGEHVCKVSIHNEGNGVWSLYMQKNEAYGEVYVWNAYIPQTKYYVTYPNTQISSLPDGSITAGIAGTVYRSYRVYDSSGNGNDISFSYGSDGLAYSAYTWLAGWNGYQLRAVHKSQFMAEVNANGYWGMTAAGGSGTADWVRTTQAGIIPYQGGGLGNGHSNLGTSSWYFAHIYVDRVHAAYIVLGTGTYENTVMQAFDDGDSNNYGCELTIGGGGNVFIGSGESHINLRTDLQSSGNRLGIEAYGKAAENMYISSDGAICFLVNCNTVANRKGILMDATGNLVPGTNNNQNLGNGTKNWNNGHINYIYTNIISYTTGSYRATIKFNTDRIILYNSLDTSLAHGVTILMPPSFENTSYPSIYPLTNGQGNIGSSSNKWNQFYATNTTISSSDRREKKEISYIGQDSEYDDTNMPKEIFMKFMRGLLACIFKRTDGESDRPHHGFIAQDIEKLMERLGIKDHAGFIKSPKTRNVEVEKEVTKEDGTIEVIKEMAQEIIPGEYVYGLRYEEFIADNIKYTQYLDEENQKQAKVIEQQQQKIQEFETRLSDMEAILNKLLNAA